MAAASVLQSSPAGSTSAAERREAHLRLLRASWAASNGLPLTGGAGSGALRAGEAMPVWSSAPRAGGPSPLFTTPSFITPSTSAPRPITPSTPTTRTNARATNRPGPDALHAPRPRGMGTSVSLTRRGRLLLVGLPIALGVIALILLGAFLTSQAHAGEGAPVSTTTVEVSVVPGETLWGIAVEHSPERDPRVVVSEMVELNNLHSSLVQAGQRLVIPVDR